MGYAGPLLFAAAGFMRQDRVDRRVLLGGASTIGTPMPRRRNWPSDWAGTRSSRRRKVPPGPAEATAEAAPVIRRRKPGTVPF